MIRAWAVQWGVPLAAVLDLEQRMGLHAVAITPAAAGHTEAWVQSRVRLAAAAEGIRAWRNNVGVLKDGEDGRPVRFGLANDSPALNKHLKSSDLIGWRPVVIHGVKVAQFWCRECKEPGWQYTGTEREQAQKRWIEAVLADGGDAAFVSDGTA